jgi:hypothetical protein
MSTGSRCWMGWMWYGYIPSERSVRQTLMCGTQKRAEIIFVLVRGLRWTMSVMFSSPFTFRCTWRSARRFTPFSQILVNTSEHTSVGDSSSRMSQPMFFDSSSGATVAKPYKKCISAYSSSENDMFTVSAHYTIITARSDCSVCYMKHYWSCNMSTPT